MTTRSVLGGLLTSVLLLGGCYLPPSSVQAPPPAPAAPLEAVPSQPGPTYVWVPGHWTIPPRDYVWVPGHWEPQANGTVWVDGFWRHN